MHFQKDCRQEVDRSPAIRRVIALLDEKSPLSPKEISRGAYIALSTLEGGGYLRKMKLIGLIRVQGWAKNHNGFTTPLYALGSGADCPRPKFNKKDKDSCGMARIVAALKFNGNLCVKELATLARISANTIKNAKYMESLLEQKRIHIAEWRRSPKGHLQPLYCFGAGDNSPKPAMLSRQEIQLRHRSRKNGITQAVQRKVGFAELLTALK